MGASKNILSEYLDNLEKGLLDLYGVKDLLERLWSQKVETIELDQFAAKLGENKNTAQFKVFLSLAFYLVFFSAGGRANHSPIGRGVIVT